MSKTIYIKNNLDYAISFTLGEGALKKKIEFDCFRVFNDTGNVATTGVTPLDEDIFKQLYEANRPFKDHVDSGLLVKTKDAGATSVANKMEALAKENATLREQLEQKTKEASTATSEENRALADENASLKKQLEALTKGKKGKTDKDSTEGF